MHEAMQPENKLQQVSVFGMFRTIALAISVPPSFNSLFQFGDNRLITDRFLPHPHTNFCT